MRLSFAQHLFAYKCPTILECTVEGRRRMSGVRGLGLPSKTEYKKLCPRPSFKR